MQALQQHHRIPAADGGVLDAHTVEPAGGSARWAILAHGGPGGSQDGPAGLFAEAARALADSGLASLRYDARGSGASSGQFLDTTLTSLTCDLRTARAWLAAQHHPDQLALIGESLGGTIAVAGLEGTEQALVLLYAATQPEVEGWQAVVAVPTSQRVCYPWACRLRQDTQHKTNAFRTAVRIGVGCASRISSSGCSRCAKSEASTGT